MKLFSWMFKEKTSKKRISTHNTCKDTSTLDARHQNVISSLQINQDNIKTLTTKHASIVKELELLNNTIREFKVLENTESVEYNLLWTSNVYFKELAKSIKESIIKIESADDEIEYFENTGNILFKYYDLIEQQNNQNQTLQEVSTLTYQRPSVKGRKKIASPASLTILDALSFIPSRGDNSDKITLLSSSSALLELDESIQNSPHHLSTHPTNPTHPNNITHHHQSNISNSSTVFNFQSGPPSALMKSVSKMMDKASLVDEYLAQVDLTHIKANNNESLGLCPRCQIQLTCIHQDGAMVCAECGYQELLLIEQNRPLIRQANKEASHYSYKRINHFREWCSQVQGKESTDIPEEIFENILQEIKKEKIQDTRKLTYSKMREIMKKLKINKYYEHIHYIINRINGVPTPHFNPELEEKLCSMFKEIQGPFLKHCPKERKNFLSYSYVLYKFFQILNMHEYLRFFPLLKSYSAHPF